LGLSREYSGGGGGGDGGGGGYGECIYVEEPEKQNRWV